MFAVTLEKAKVVAIWKDAEVLPAGITTCPPGIAREESLDSDIVSPPAGAAELIETVPRLGLPPVTELGSSVSETSFGAVIWNDPD